MTKDEIMEKLEARAMSGEPFTFAQLHRVSSEPASYRMADRYIQKLRKNGVIEGKRVGRTVVWSLLPSHK